MPTQEVPSWLMLKRWRRQCGWEANIRIQAGKRSAVNGEAGAVGAAAASG